MHPGTFATDRMHKAAQGIAHLRLRRLELRARAGQVAELLAQAPGHRLILLRLLIHRLFYVNAVL